MASRGVRRSPAVRSRGFARLSPTVYVLGGPEDGRTFLENDIASSPDLAFEDVTFPDASDLAKEILEGIDPCLN